MGEVTHEQVNLMLHLYDLRREARMRQARSWYFINFHPQSMADVRKLSAEENASMRMVTSYWAMVANIVSRGLIDEEFFFENSGEQWLVWERLKPIAAEVRAATKNPHAYKKLEEHAARLEAWREKRAPGHNDAMREMLKQLRPVYAAAAQKAGGKAKAKSGKKR